MESKKLKFLLYSCSGEGAQILKRIELEGNEVALYIKDPIYKTCFQGLLPHIDNPDSFIDKDTIIIFDMSGNGTLADTYKRKGHLVYGASSFADDLEHDRDFGFDCMKECGIQIPEMQKFNDFSSGIKYVQEHPEMRLVFKPNGSMPCKLTYVSKDSVELVAYLKFVEKQFKSKIDDFILQEFIEGEVISSEFFCDGTKFLHPANHTIEVKKSMNDELGPSTGCSGNITWPCYEDKIISEGILKAEALCQKHNYIGQLDLNAVVNEKGLYGLEWTPRFGYSATPSLLSLVEGDLGEFFSNITRGQMNKLDLQDQYAGSVRVSIPPYPAEPTEGVDTEEISPNLGVPIQNYEEYEGDCYFYEVMLDEEGQLCHSGGTGVILEAQGIGSTPEGSFEMPYKIAEEIHIPDKQYRTDLNKLLPEMVEKAEQYA